MRQQRWIPWAIAAVAVLLVFVATDVRGGSGSGSDDLVLDRSASSGASEPTLPGADAIAAAEEPSGEEAAVSEDLRDGPPATASSQQPDAGTAYGDDPSQAAATPAAGAQPDDQASATQDEQPSATEQAAATASPTAVVAQAPPPPPPASGIEGYRLRVPRLGIDAFMLDLGVDDDGVMEVPREAQTVAWYRFTSVAGEPGNILLGGHITWGGATAVFRYLEEMSDGDEVFIDTTSGETIHYVVRETWWADPYAINDVRKVIGTRIGQQSITLFTCGGVWNTDAREYSHRRVVTAYRV